MTQEPFPGRDPGEGKTLPQTAQDNGLENAAPGEAEKKSRLIMLWEGLTQAGLADSAVRLGTHILLVALVLVVAWVMRAFYFQKQAASQPEEAAMAASLPTPTPTALTPQLPDYQAEMPFYAGIPRLALLHTTIPSRPRTDVIKYTVEQGDTIFGIAEKFGLEPQTILWGNQLLLADNPHSLRPEQELNILPVNGTYYQWQAGDGLNGVSKFFGVTPEDIIHWPGNNLNPEEIGDYAHPNIAAGSWLIVPGGERELSHGARRLSRAITPAWQKFWVREPAARWSMEQSASDCSSGLQTPTSFPASIIRQPPTTLASILMETWATPRTRRIMAWWCMPAGIIGAMAT